MAWPRVPAWAVLACFVLMMSTSGHEIGVPEVETLNDAAQPDSPIRAPLHQQQPCCLENPVPATCRCFVVHKSSPMTDLVVSRDGGEDAMAASHIADLRMKLKAATEDVHMVPSVSKLGAEAEATAHKLAMLNQRVQAAKGKVSSGQRKVKQAKKDAEKEQQKEVEAREEDAAEETKGKSDEQAAGEAEKEARKEKKKVDKEKKAIKKEEKKVAQKEEGAQKLKTKAESAAADAKVAKKNAKKEGESQADRDTKDAAETEDAKKAMEVKKAEGKAKEAAEDKEANKAKVLKDKMKAKEAKQTIVTQEGLVKIITTHSVTLTKTVSELQSTERAALKKESSAQEAVKQEEAAVKRREADLKSAAKGAITSAKAANEASSERKKEEAAVDKLTASTDALKKKSAAVTKELGSSVKAESNDKVKAASDEEKAQSIKDEEDKEKELAQDSASKMKESVSVVESEQKASDRLAKKVKSIAPSKKQEIAALEKQYAAELALEEEPKSVANKAHAAITNLQPKCDKMEFSTKDLQVRIAAMEAEIKTDTAEFHRLHHLAEETQPRGHLWTVRYGGCTASDDMGEMAGMAIKKALEDRKEADQEWGDQIEAEAKKVETAEAAAEEAAVAVTKDKEHLMQAELTVKSPEYYNKHVPLEATGSSAEQNIKALEEKVAFVEDKVKQLEQHKNAKSAGIKSKLEEDRDKLQQSKNAVVELKAVLKKAEANLSISQQEGEKESERVHPMPEATNKGAAEIQAASKQRKPQVQQAEQSLPSSVKEAETRVDKATEALSKATDKDGEHEAMEELKQAQKNELLVKSGQESPEQQEAEQQEAEQQEAEQQEAEQQEAEHSSEEAEHTDAKAEEEKNAEEGPGSADKEQTPNEMPLDGKTNRMLTAYVQQKRSLCQMSFQEKSPSQPEQMEKSVKLHLNCAKEANVKGEIKHRELRVAMAKKVHAMAACATTAYAKAAKRSASLQVKLVNSHVGLAGWKAEKLEQQAALQQCTDELQIAQTAHAESRTTLTSIHDRMKMIKARIGRDSDQMIAKLKKGRAEEASKKAQIKETLLKLKGEGATSIEAKRKAIKMMADLAAEERKIAGEMKMAAKDHAKILKARFVAEQLKELGDGVLANQTAATKKLQDVKSEQKKIADTEKAESAEAKKDQQKLKAEEAKLAHSKGAEKELKADAEQDKKKVDAAKKQVKDENAKAKKAEKKVEKEQKKADKEKEKAAEAEEKVTKDRRKEAAEKSKIPELKEEAKAAALKVVAVKEEVSETKKAAKDAENTDGKTAKAERETDEAEKANMDAKKAEVKKEAMEQKLQADKERLRQKKKNAKKKEQKASQDKVIEAKSVGKIEEAKGEVQSLKSKQAAAKADEIAAEMSSQALEAEKERLKAKLSEYRQQLEAQLQVNRGKASATMAEAKAEQAKSEQMLNELDRILPDLHQQKANVANQVKLTKKIDAEARAAKANVQSVQEMSIEGEKELATIEKHAGRLGATEKLTKTKLDKLAKTLAPYKEAHTKKEKTAHLLKQAISQDKTAQARMKAAGEDLEQKARDRKFAEKVADEHLTGHVKGALFEAARAAHAHAKAALKTAQQQTAKAAHDRNELAEEAKAAAAKSLKLDLDRMPELQEYFEVEAKLKAQHNLTQATKALVAEKKADVLRVKNQLKTAKAKSEHLEDAALSAHDAAGDNELKEAALESKVALEKRLLTQAVHRASVALATSAAAKAKVASMQHARDVINSIHPPSASESEVAEAQKSAKKATDDTQEKKVNAKARGKKQGEQPTSLLTSLLSYFS